MNGRRIKTLNTLVRVRRRQEDQRAQALANAQRDVRVAMEQREALENYQRHMLDRAGESSQGEFDATAVRRFYQHERHLSRLVSERDADIRRLGEIEEKKRAELEQALKKRRMVEQLETKAVRQYRQFRTDQEQKFHDEIASARAVRDNNGGVGS